MQLTEIQGVGFALVSRVSSFGRESEIFIGRLLDGSLEYCSFHEKIFTVKCYLFFHQQPDRLTNLKVGDSSPPCLGKSAKRYI